MTINNCHELSDNEHQGYPLPNFYAVQDKAWMYSQLMIDWIEKVHQPWVELKQGRPTMVILDEFSAHLTKTPRDALSNLGCHLETIPGAYRWRLQVMSVGLYDLFQDVVRHLFDMWLFFGLWSCNSAIMGCCEVDQDQI
jgi:DDE superfamily endonuclease